MSAIPKYAFCIKRSESRRKKKIPQYDLTTKDTVKLAARGSDVFVL